MIKVLIETDLEGASLVDSIDLMQGEGYAFACDRLAADLDAAIRGALEAGAEEVLFEDGHGGGGNVTGKHKERYPAIRRARQCSLDDPGIREGVTALFQIGAHAMAGTEKAFLDHTQSSATWHDYRINGERCGEIAQAAYFAGEAGIPFTMVSGDRAACEEAARLAPGVLCAAVKTAEIRNRATVMNGEEALENIREAARLGVLRAREIAPVRLTLPAVGEVKWNRTDYCDAAAAANPRAFRADARTLRYRIEKIERFSDLLP